MPRYSIFICLLVFMAWFNMDAQSFTVEGVVLDATTKVPIPYATIYNRSVESGTLTNTEGYFKIQTQSDRDSVFVIFVGYEKQVMALRPDVHQYTVYLKESPQLLNEIVVTPKSNLYLYSLLAACRDEEGGYHGQARAYLELKTYRDHQQVELVEGYYNADIKGYDLGGLQLKTGRLALKPYDDRLFVSLESSGIISRMPFFLKNPFFPENPMTVDKKELRKKYDLSLDRKYIDGAGDSIYVIVFTPTEKVGHYFAGKAWINLRYKTFVKITFQCPDAVKYPFLPLFATDSISHVAFDITKTFSQDHGQIRLNHIDFTYSVQYKSRSHEIHSKSYKVTTQALLYVYDAGHPFILPRTGIRYQQNNDYRLINASPYNAFFWKYNTEYRINSRDNRNELFYAANPLVSGESIFGPGMVFRKGVFEQPYVPWSEDRIMLKPHTLDTVGTPELYDREDKNKIRDEKVKSDKYKLVVRPYMDINTYHDSTDVLTSVIFDPFESFYYLYQDKRTQCFINMFFDLCEMERRNFMEKVKRYRPDADEINWMYDLFEGQMYRLTYRFLKDVERGTNEHEMMRYNDMVKRSLGIDNIEIFQPYGQKRRRGQSSD